MLIIERLHACWPVTQQIPVEAAKVDKVEIHRARSFGNSKHTTNPTSSQGHITS
jgi:hypothetical protein